MTDEDLPEILYAVVHYEEEDYHFMPIVSDVFAEAVAEHLDAYCHNITTYISNDQPEKKSILICIMTYVLRQYDWCALWLMHQLR